MHSHTKICKEKVWKYIYQHVNNGSLGDRNRNYFLLSHLYPSVLSFKQNKTKQLVLLLLEKKKTFHFGKKKMIKEQYCQKLKFRITQTWVEILPLPLTLCVTLDKQPNLPEPPFPRLSNGEAWQPLLRVITKRNELTYTSVYLTRCLACSKHSKSSYHYY